MFCEGALACRFLSPGADPFDDGDGVEVADALRVHLAPGNTGSEHDALDQAPGIAVAASSRSPGQRIMLPPEIAASR